jgi:hypothetical protein
VSGAAASITFEVADSTGTTATAKGTITISAASGKSARVR